VAPGREDRDVSWFAALDRALERALAPWNESDLPTVVLFSGGLDSGLLAWELRRNPRLILLTVGLPGSPDLAAAEDGAKLLGARWVRAELAPDEVRAAAARIRDSEPGLAPTPAAVLTALAVALDRAPGRVVLCGQGADELFLGYAHFRGLGPAAARQRAAVDWAALRDRDWPRAERVARASDRTAFAPYLHPDFVAAVEQIPIGLRLPQGEPKRLLRRWAEARGLPASIARRPKHAFQYSSRVDRVVRSAARKRAAAPDA
jgi:asparagine synthase (glutamine-hydrolysing)